VLDSSPGYFADVPTPVSIPKLGSSVKTERTRVVEYFGLIVIKGYLSQLSYTITPTYTR
jgi:hypothetical protein